MRALDFKPFDFRHKILSGEVAKDSKEVSILGCPDVMTTGLDTIDGRETDNRAEYEEAERKSAYYGRIGIRNVLIVERMAVHERSSVF